MKKAKQKDVPLKGKCICGCEDFYNTIGGPQCWSCDKKLEVSSEVSDGDV